MRRRRRLAVLKELSSIGTVSMRQEDMVRKQLRMVSTLDVFDILLRVVNIAFVLWHASVYPDPTYSQVDTSGEPKRLEFLEQPLKAILDIEWGDPNRSIESKVDEFMGYVVQLTVDLESEENHRLWARILILLFFVRCVIYMRAHPRIAILYSTLRDMFGDFVHFMLLAATLYCVLAFLATWSFGDKSADFGDFQTSMYTQFRMIVGEHDLPKGDAAGFKFTYGLYAVVYFLMVFSLLLNFFLAIVIDSYSNVKDSVKHCKVENSLVWDLVFAFGYPILAPLRGWPARHRLLTVLMRAEADAQAMGDDDKRDRTAVQADHLVTVGLLGDIGHARDLISFYHWVCPAVTLNFKEPKLVLEHEKVYKMHSVLDQVYKEVKGEANAEEDEEEIEGEDLTKTLHRKLSEFHQDLKRNYTMGFSATRNSEVEGGGSMLCESTGAKGGSDPNLSEMMSMISAQSAAQQKQMDAVMHSVGQVRDDVVRCMAYVGEVKQSLTHMQGGSYASGSAGTGHMAEMMEDNLLRAEI